jgi:hypothetical protein
MVAGSDLLPFHKPFAQWSEEAMERLTEPSVLRTLSDETLDRLIVELEAFIGE